LCVIWTIQERFLLAGDEPHYLIMARSVVLDHDLDLRNNYEEDALTGDIYGAVTPHAFRGDTRWPPYHSVGLSLILAYPFRYAGVEGARLTLIAVATLIPIMVLWWLRDHLSSRSAILLGITLALSVPLAIAPLHVYPDIVAAALLTSAVLALLHWWQTSAEPPTGGWIAVWSLVGFLPWLQSRFLAPWLLLMLAGVLLALRASAAARLRLFAGLLVSLAAVALLGVVNYGLYENPLGPPRWAELTQSPSRMLMVFLGLHFDQAQGLFMQQPLWLFGLIGLAPFARAHPREAAWLALVYLSTIGPASMQMGRYGGAGTIGRYAWAGAFLWVVPFGHFAAARPRDLPRAIAVALALQVVMTAHWIVAPDVLAVNLDAGIPARETLWPSELRYVLPSFYFWDFTSYLRYPPNVVALTGALLLVWSGVGLSRREV
jgi:hypothetical protein